MKIICSAANKGGVGKTTFVYNLAAYLRRNYRVLLIDFDDSCNLTNRYGSFQDKNQTVVSLFDYGTVVPIQVEKNLDLIAGHKEVEQLKERLVSRSRRECIFGKWLAQNEEWLEKMYDYVLIDTENDEGILTQNALIVSDLVVGIAEAGKDSFLALLNLKNFVSELNEDFQTNAQVTFVANKIHLKENASLELLETLVGFSGYVGYLPHRTVLAEDKALFE